MDRGTSWATVHGVAKSWTRLSDFTFFVSGSHDTEILPPSQLRVHSLATGSLWGGRGSGCQPRLTREDGEVQVFRGPASGGPVPSLALQDGITPVAFVPMVGEAVPCLASLVNSVGEQTLCSSCLHKDQGCRMLHC